MKKLVLVAGVVLVLSFVFPNGISLPVVTPPVEKPDEVVVTVPADPKIAELLKNATPADKARVRGIYSGLVTVLRRDAVKKRLKTTEQWADLQANTLELAVDQVGKYPGLDVAINDVFLRVMGTDDVLPANDETRGKLIEACEIICASAR